MPDVKEINFKSANDFLSHISANTPYQNCLLSNLYMLGSDLGGESTGLLLGKCFVLECWKKKFAPVFVLDGCTIDGELLWGIRKAIYPYILRLSANSLSPSIYFMNADKRTITLADSVLSGICRIWFANNKITQKSVPIVRKKAVDVSQRKISITSHEGLV